MRRADQRGQTHGQDAQLGTSLADLEVAGMEDKQEGPPTHSVSEDKDA